MGLLELTTPGVSVEMGVLSPFRARVRWTLDPGTGDPTSQHKMVIAYATKSPHKVRIGSGLYGSQLSTTQIELRKYERQLFKEINQLWDTDADHAAWDATATAIDWNTYKGNPGPRQGNGLWMKANQLAANSAFDCTQPLFNLNKPFLAHANAQPGKVAAPDLTLVELDPDRVEITLGFTWPDADVSNWNLPAVIRLKHRLSARGGHFKIGEGAPRDNGDGTGLASFGVGSPGGSPLTFPAPSTIGVAWFNFRTNFFSDYSWFTF